MLELARESRLQLRRPGSPSSRRDNKKAMGSASRRRAANARMPPRGRVEPLHVVDRDDQR